MMILGQKPGKVWHLVQLLICGLATVLLISACAVPSTPIRVAPTKPLPAAPQPSVDAAAAKRLVAAWMAQGLKAEAEYSQVAAKPVDRIEWKAMNVVLSKDPAQMDSVMMAVGEFAARASRPVDVHLYARNRKQDGVLSQALKKGAVRSGGRNSVKLDHHIHPGFQARVQLSVREGAQ